MPEATFYFDLGSPYAYLTAERIDDVLPEPAVWQPVSLGGLFKANGRSSWALGGDDSRRSGVTEVERRAYDYGLEALHWPEPWPTNYLYAMRTTTYAFQVGRGREFAIEAFRDAFASGRDLGWRSTFWMRPSGPAWTARRLTRLRSDPEIKLALRTATDAAHALGVFGVPTVRSGPARSSSGATTVCPTRLRHLQVSSNMELFGCMFAFAWRLPFLTY